MYIKNLKCPAFLFVLLLNSIICAEEQGKYFVIKVVDKETNRGVPIVELSTMNNVSYYTDSAGIIAFHEPGLMNTKVWFSVKADGYEFQKDHFGYAGIALQTNEGSTTELKVHRLNRAQRLYRITGQGIYKDSILASLPIPVEYPVLNARVIGQDSAMAVVYKEKIFWLWGDTIKPQHPLGLFHAAGATSKIPGRQGGLEPHIGINLCYFSKHDEVKAMCPFNGEGPIWPDAPVVICDHNGKDSLLIHYSRIKPMFEVVERGIALFDDNAQVFEKLKEYDLARRKWQFLFGHVMKYAESGIEYFCTGPFKMVRVRSNLNKIIDQNEYEAFTCLKPGTNFMGKDSVLNRDAEGRLLYQWRKDTPPITAAQERELLNASLLSPSEAYFQPRSADNSETPILASGSLNWNSYRKKWVAIAIEMGGSSSYLGEVWYTEANDITGPWSKCWKIVTHNDYSFYNPVHHKFFDQNDGQIIYFEGTYTKCFSGTKVPTPRYEYNQIMYKLDLSFLKNVQ